LNQNLGYLQYKAFKEMKKWHMSKKFKDIR